LEWYYSLFVKQPYRRSDWLLYKTGQALTGLKRTKTATFSKPHVMKGALSTGLQAFAEFSVTLCIHASRL
jgi:hypothetical protein